MHTRGRKRLVAIGINKKRKEEREGGISCAPLNKLKPPRLEAASRKIVIARIFFSIKTVIPFPGREISERERERKGERRVYRKNEHRLVMSIDILPACWDCGGCGNYLRKFHFVGLGSNTGRELLPDRNAEIRHLHNTRPLLTSVYFFILICSSVKAGAFVKSNDFPLRNRERKNNR